jgi:hypothetical protein
MFAADDHQFFRDNRRRSYAALLALRAAVLACTDLWAIPALAELGLYFGTFIAEGELGRGPTGVLRVRLYERS